MGLETAMNFTIKPKKGHKFNVNGMKLDAKSFDLIYFRKFHYLADKLASRIDEIDANTCNEYECTFDAESNGIDIILDTIRESYQEGLNGYCNESYWDIGEVLRNEAIAIHNLEVFKHYIANKSRFDFVAMLDALTETDYKEKEIAEQIMRQEEIVDWDNIEVEFYNSY